MGHLLADEKLKKICDSLREDALKPAEEQAELLMKKTEIQAEQLVKDAREEAQDIIRQATEEATSKMAAANAEITKTLERSMEVLKQSIENTLFKQSLVEWLDSSLADPKINVELIQAILAALEKQRLDSDLTIYISKALNMKEINKLLGKEILKKLRESSVMLGNFSGGVKVKVNQKSFELEVTTAALQELVIRYLRKDFREMLFR